MKMEKPIEVDLRENFEEFFVQAFSYMHEDTQLSFEPYLRYVCDVYQHIRNGDRILFNQPPRSLKSWTSKIYVAWYLGRNPGRSVMLASNIQDLAELNLAHIREILRSGWYKKVFPQTKIAKGSSKTRLTTTRHGGVMAVSMQGSLAGFGADLLIVDDGNKIGDATRPDRLQAVNEKFDGELYSRLNNKRKGIVIALQHRLNDNDLSGHLIELGYKVFAFALIAPSTKKYRFRNGEVWRREKGNLLTDTYSRRDILMAQKSTKPDFFWFFQQGKGINARKLIPMDAFRLLETKKEAGPFVISVDAAQSDGPNCSYSVIQVWQQLPSSLHLFHQFRAQCGYSTLQSTAKSLIKKFRPCAVLIETAAAGGALYSVLREQLPDFNIVAISPRGTKEERLDCHREKIRRGAISLQSTSDCLVDFLLEFSASHKEKPEMDIIDATTQMLDYAEKHPVWYFPPERRAQVAGRPSSTGAPIPLACATDSGVRGIAIARGIPFFRRL
jgi:phage terminase large subunit-like protein